MSVSIDKCRIPFAGFRKVNGSVFPEKNKSFVYVFRLTYANDILGDQTVPPAGWYCCFTVLLRICYVVSVPFYIYRNEGYFPGCRWFFIMLPEVFKKLIETIIATTNFRCCISTNFQRIFFIGWRKGFVDNFTLIYCSFIREDIVNAIGKKRRTDNLLYKTVLCYFAILS